MLQELNLQEMNEIEGGFPMGAIMDGYCTVLEIQIENNFDNWSQGQQQEAFDLYGAFCMN